MESAQLAAIQAHIINRIIYPQEGTKAPLKEIVLEARDTVGKLFEGDPHIGELIDIIDRAVLFSDNDANDLENIHQLGEGWTGEETLGISLYCALKYQDDFSAGMIAAVNHSGDSDSTGAVTGNILGALLGYDAIEEQW
jgi:ADP-ribosylglycohydrolase